VAKKKKAKAKARAKAGKGRKRAAGKARKAVKSRKAPKKASRRPAARKTKKRAAATGARARKAPAQRPARKPTAAGAPAGSEMFGEGNWKADEQYRKSLRKFSQTHDVEALAREAGLELEPDLRKSDDTDVAESARKGAEEEPEW
jgi:hypothetical protein